MRRMGAGWADLASLLQPKTSSGTFWSETRRRGSRASRPYSIFGEWNPCQAVPGPEGGTTPSETPLPPLTPGLLLGSLGMLLLTKTSWARSVSRSRRILPGTTGRSVWVRPWTFLAPGCLPSPPALPLSLRGRLPVACLIFEISRPRAGHSLIHLSPCSEHSMPPRSCATSESWGRAQRVRRPQSGGWPATATRASGLASPPTGDTQVRGGGPYIP